MKFIFFYLLACLSFSSITVAHNTITSHSNLKVVPVIGIRINAGAKYTNNKRLEIEIRSLKTTESLINQMKIGLESDLSDVEWQKFSTEKIFLDVMREDGTIHVYAQLMDKAGNSSPIESNSIILDTKPPTDLSISIDDGAAFTNDKLGRVIVKLHASEAAQVMISNNEKFEGSSWEKYRSTIKWMLETKTGEGPKQVYVKFRDQAGNISESQNSSITFDVTPPKMGSIVANNGKTHVNSRKVRLLVVNEEAAKVRIASGGLGKNYDMDEVVDGELKITWRTDSIDGMKSFKAYFMDEAGNIGKEPAETSIIRLRERHPNRLW